MNTNPEMSDDVTFQSVEEFATPAEKLAAELCYFENVQELLKDGLSRHAALRPGQRDASVMNNLQDKMLLVNDQIVLARARLKKQMLLDAEVAERTEDGDTPIIVWTENAPAVTDSGVVLVGDDDIIREDDDREPEERL